MNPYAVFSIIILETAFLHISPSCFRKGENMNIKHFNIMVTDQECGHARESGNPADLTAYLLDRLPHKPELLRPAVVLCPGGGYGFVSPREDQPVAMEFLAAGCQVFSLHYSVAPETFPVALMELAKAVALVKSHACEWNIDTERIMVCGFSAGGHLAACLGMMWNRDFLYGPLNMAPEDIQPKGMILCYPVITSGEFGHKRSFEQLLGGKAGDPRLRELVSLELQAGPHTPRTFLWHTWTDQSVPVENSLLLAQALKKAGVSLEMHIYSSGRHGLSLATEEVSDSTGDCLVPHCQGWMVLVKEWIKEKDRE